MTSEYSIPLFSDGEIGNQDTFNRPITYIQQCLNDLRSRVALIGDKSAITVTDVPCYYSTSDDDSSVECGDIVYYDTSDNVYKKAKALLRDIPGEHGESVADDCAIAQGIIINLDTTNHTGTLLVGGTYTSDTVVTHCLGTSPKSGLYYLSPVTAGKATQDLGSSLRQPILTYMGSNKFTMTMFYMAHDQHFHQSLVMSPSLWVSVGEADAPKNSAGVAANYKYQSELDASFQALGGLGADTTAFFADGLLDITNFAISDGTVWAWTEASPTSVVLFTQWPFSYNQAIVRGIDSKSDKLTTEDENGIISLTLQEYSTAEPDYARYAISGIASNTMQVTPVVSDITAGPGISAYTTANGRTTISLSTSVGAPLDAENVNLNGVSAITSGIYTLMHFPESKQSSMIISKTISGSTATLEVSAWAMVMNGSGAIGVKLYFVPEADSGTSPALPSEPDRTLSMSCNAEEGVLTYAETDSTLRMTIKGSGMLIAVFSADKPGSSIDLLRYGFKLYTPSTITDEEAPSEVKVQAVTYSAYAGEKIYTYDVLKLNSVGKAVKASHLVESDCSAVVGVALNDAEIDESVEYMVSGTLFSTGLSKAISNYSNGGTLYLSGGKLNGTPPSTGFVIPCGLALTGTALQVRIGQPILDVLSID